MAPQEALGVAIVGSGIFVREEHIPAIDACEGLVLKAVYSRSLKTAQETIQDRGDVDIYTDESKEEHGQARNLDALLRREDIYAVVVALPIVHQPKYIKACLQAAKHILSEKPIAESVAEARALIQWYEQPAKAATWGVAENFRYMNSFRHAAAEIMKLGKIQTFRCQGRAMVNAGGKYYETEWRKNPAYQGGFLLDGGVHSTAVLRLLLGDDHITRVAAWTAQLQAHLPPVDTIEASATTQKGAIGTISLSFGSTAPPGTEWTISCEHGTVTVNSRSSVSVTRDGKTETNEVPDERTGVPAEIRAWEKGLRRNQLDQEQSPQEALADMELIEALLNSGKTDGAFVNLTYQKGKGRNQ